MHKSKVIRLTSTACISIYTYRWHWIVFIFHFQIMLLISSEEALSRGISVWVRFSLCSWAHISQQRQHNFSKNALISGRPRKCIWKYCIETKQCTNQTNTMKQRQTIKYANTQVYKLNVYGYGLFCIQTVRNNIGTESNHMEWVFCIVYCAPV